MTNNALVGVVGAVLLVLTTAAVARADGNGLSGARAATAQFHRLDAAKAAGYTAEVVDLNGVACIDDIDGHTGGMGIHFLNPDLLDGNVDESTPELVIYESTKNGQMRLVAVEYLVLRFAWEAAHPGAPAPTLFGQPMELVSAGNRYGLPDFYEMHAWIWKDNPLGMHNDWNPTVTCAYA
ncbi:MAG TPA: hypothetical protein VFJ93_13810 [Gaiellaceae bacterium]|nr:hypothetical protein [Gaiellaceae bacterium]